MRQGYGIEEFVNELRFWAEDDACPEGLRDKQNLVELAMRAVSTLGAWECFSCGLDTFASGEDFYVHDELWSTYGVEGMLCIGCFEKRLGRRLRREDFKSAGRGSETHFPHYQRSDRFRDRLGE